jgi:transcriptional regulator with XRE-family HTH domain
MCKASSQEPNCYGLTGLNPIENAIFASLASPQPAQKGPFELEKVNEMRYGDDRPSCERTRVASVALWPMNEIPQNPHRKLWMNEKGEVFQNVLPAGNSLRGAAALLVPTPEESRSSLLRIRKNFRLSRAQLAVALGVGFDTLRRWESGERVPSGPARRLIQIVADIFFSDEPLSGDFGAIMIGRINLQKLRETKRELLSVSARSLTEKLKQTGDLSC